jgi:sugar/nucleoside kinase (ribokinase family)
LIAFVDWANLSLASNIWDGVLHDIIKPSGKKDFIFFFDLCDPSKKSVQQIDELLDLISSFSHYGRVTLGLNENETIKIWCAIHGVDITKPSEKSKIPSVKEAGDGIFKAMSIDCLLVHPIDRAIAFRKKETIEFPGRLVPAPKVLTGGGDNLNAGYCLGLLQKLPVEQCVLLGMAASGAYIQNGESPDISAIIDYIDTWKRELVISPGNRGKTHVKN